MKTVRIYDRHGQDEIEIHKYNAMGTIEQAMDAARTKCGQMQATRGRMVWVDIIEDGQVVDHRAVNEEIKAR